jgi:DNA polymerase-3 subunit gamma/tau
MTYDGVLGQKGTIKILRQFVRLGKARQQSYLFGGPFGSGKTTLGRILARALLCSAPTEQGDPCDQCASCRSLLTLGTAEGYVEVDAATNSGKDQMRKIVEEIQFSTFSGRHRVYLFDESHQLTANALDAMLKPLEETVQGTQDKQLVCIFCTTEPEKMRATILSRCAPAFIVRPVSPDKIAGLLAKVCEAENIVHEADLLQLIAEITECHIRDALKSLEGIAMLGEVNRDNVTAYLHLDLNGFYLDILENLGGDISKVLASLAALLERCSPATCYEKLSETALIAYQSGLEAVRVEAFRDKERLMGLTASHGDNLLGMAVKFSERPAKSSAGALKLDLLQMHARLVSGRSLSPRVEVASSLTLTPVPAPVIPAPALTSPVPSPTPSPTPSVSPMLVVDPMNPTDGRLEGVPGEETYKFSDAAKKQSGPPETPSATSNSMGELEAERFCWLLARRVRELSEGGLGPKRRPDLDRP